MVVLVNGQPRDTTVISPTLANVLILGSDTANIGTLTLIARNPVPGGGDSNAFALQVVQSNPLPRLDSITPDSANAGGPAFSLVLQGTSFAPGAIVRFGTRDLQTEYISSTNLVAQVTPADLQLGGLVPVRVINPQPGGGNSGAVFFSITTLPPTITSVTPNPIVGAATPVAVTVDGTNFAGASVVRFNGVAKQTQFVSGTRLVMTLQPFDLVGITSAVIEVFTPPPGGGTSNSVTVGVTPLAGASADRQFPGSCGCCRRKCCNVTSRDWLAVLPDYSYPGQWSCATHLFREPDRAADDALGSGPGGSNHTGDYCIHAGTGWRNIECRQFCRGWWCSTSANTGEPAAHDWSAWNAIHSGRQRYQHSASIRHSGKRPEPGHHVHQRNPALDAADGE